MRTTGSIGPPTEGSSARLIDWFHSYRNSVSFDCFNCISWSGKLIYATRRAFRTATGTCYSIWLKLLSAPFRFVYRRGCVFIPRDPWNAYAGIGWRGFDDWLGRPYAFEKAREKARSFAKSRRISTQAEWWESVSARTIPGRVPERPSVFYKDQWISWDDWLAG